MKKVSFLFALILSIGFVSAQSISPVSWKFTSKKVSEGVYEIQMTADIQNGWHLYSQSQPSDAIAIPTSFTFNKNPLLALEGKIIEQGKLEKFTDKDLGVSANQYSKQVVFTQRIKTKGKAKTAVTGKVEFQTCDDKKCLPPKTVNFTVSI